MALAHGHSPAAIDAMPIRDLELLASYAQATQVPLWMGD